MASENGNYVTRAELRAHLDPMKSDISDIAEDVRFVRDAYIAERAVEKSSKDRGARRIGLTSLAIAAAGSLYWVQDAIAKVFH